MQTEWAWVEASIHEEPRHRMRGYRLTVDSGDQYALMAVCTHPILPSRSKKVRETGSCLRAFRLVGRQEDEHVRIVAAQPGDQLTVAKDHLCIGSAG